MRLRCVYVSLAAISHHLRPERDRLRNREWKRIGKGCTIVEVQQNSNVTYRVYDYNRVGVDGKPRELHIEKAIEVANLSAYVPQPTNGNVLANCKYFTVEKGAGEREIYHAKSFVSILAVSDGGNIDGVPLSRGDGYFVPAGSTAKLGGNADYILTCIQGE